MKNKIIHWLASGETGASSKTMAFTAMGIPCRQPHPHDPSDFNRCLLLIKTVPEIRNYFDKIALLSKSWKAIIDRWNEVERCFIDEVGLNWCKGDRASKTYALMQKIYRKED